MKFKTYKDEIIASNKVAKILIKAVKKNPNLKLGLPTGSTPIELYKAMVDNYNKKQTDYSNVITFNLDEYKDIKEDNKQSYKYFMNQHLFSKVNLKKENTHFPELNMDFDKLIEDKGGIDIQVLGIGTNGHIGFNEPNSDINSKTRVVDLDENTIKVNANKFFNGNTELVPKQAISMGLSTILKAKKIILLAFGQSKYDAIQKLKEVKEFNPIFPASALVNHKDVLVITDFAASKK